MSELIDSSKFNSICSVVQEAEEKNQKEININMADIKIVLYTLYMDNLARSNSNDEENQFYYGELAIPACPLHGDGCSIHAWSYIRGIFEKHGELKRQKETVV